jgi:hypothetical protein
MEPQWAIGALAFILAGANALLLVEVRGLIRRVDALSREVWKLKAAGQVIPPSRND